MDSILLIMCERLIDTILVSFYLRQQYYLTKMSLLTLDDTFNRKCSFQTEDSRK